MFKIPQGLSIFCIHFCAWSKNKSHTKGQQYFFCLLFCCSQFTYWKWEYLNHPLSVCTSVSLSLRECKTIHFCSPPHEVKKGNYWIRHRLSLKHEISFHRPKCQMSDKWTMFKALYRPGSERADVKQQEKYSFSKLSMRAACALSRPLVLLVTCVSTSIISSSCYCNRHEESKLSE